MEAEVLTMQVGEDGAQIKLMQEAEIIAEFVKMESTEVDLSDSKDPNAPRRFYKKVVAGDSKARRDINTGAEDKLVQNYVDGREKVLDGAAKAVGTAVTIAVIVGLTVATAGASTVGVAATGAAGAAGGTAAAAGAALTTPLMLATYGTGAVVVTIADANMGGRS